jgi:hypothetical protein
VRKIIKALIISTILKSFSLKGKGLFYVPLPTSFLKSLYKFKGIFGTFNILLYLCKRTANCRLGGARRILSIPDRKEKNAFGGAENIPINLIRAMPA